MYTLFIVCLFGVALAQQPKPCVSPQQWEGRIFDRNEKQQTTVQGTISYDATYHRARVTEDIQTSDDEIVLDVLTLYDAQLQFVYDMIHHNCSRSEIQTPWEDYGIPENATSYGQAYIGTSAIEGAGILITIWGGNFTLAPGIVLSYIATWTYQGCIPVSRTVSSPEYGNEVLSFYDVTIGIRDPNVFIPRRECLTAYEWENRYTLFAKPAKKV